jgi:hypothetical protein
MAKISMHWYNMPVCSAIVQIWLNIWSMCLVHSLFNTSNSQLFNQVLSSLHAVPLSMSACMINVFYIITHLYKSRYIWTRLPSFFHFEQPVWGGWRRKRKNGLTILMEVGEGDDTSTNAPNVFVLMCNKALNINQSWSRKMGCGHQTYASKGNLYQKKSD